MPRQRMPTLLRLARREPLQLILLNRNPSTKAHPPRKAIQEPRAVLKAQHTLRPTLRPRQRNTRPARRLDRRLLLRPQVTFAEVLDHRRLHRELNEVERHEPHDVPHPHDPDPAARNLMNVREAPVREARDDRGDELREAEGAHERVRGTFHEEEAVRARDEDEGLRDDGDLEVDDHVQLVVVVRDGRATGVLEVDAELVLEERRLDDDDDEDDRREREVDTIRHRVREDLSKIPTIRLVARQDTVDGERHDRAVVQERDDQDHERREVKVVRERKHGEANHNTDRHRARINRIVPHPLEDDTRAADRVHDRRQTRFREHDIRRTTRRVRRTLHSDTDIRLRQSRGVVRTVSRHGDQVSESLETLDDLVLVLGEHTGETVRVEDHVVQRHVLAAGRGSVLEHLGGVHMITKTQPASRLLRNRKLITGHHLHLHTKRKRVVDRLLRVLTRGVEDRE